MCVYVWRLDSWLSLGIYIYRLQRSCEGHVFTRVCQSFSSQSGGAIPECIAGGIPACLAAGGCLLQGVPVPGEVPALWVCSQGVCSWGGGGGVCRPPWKQTATVADGTHPTGMHSCSWMEFNVNKQIHLNCVLFFHWKKYYSQPIVHGAFTLWT